MDAAADASYSWLLNTSWETVGDVINMIEMPWGASPEDAKGEMAEFSPLRPEMDATVPTSDVAEGARARGYDSCKQAQKIL